MKWIRTAGAVTASGVAAVLAVAVAGSVLAGDVRAAPQRHVVEGSTCSTLSASTVIPAAVPVVGWAENLGFDRQGNLWVTRTMQNVIERYNSRGVKTASISAESPGAIRLGPGGQMYATVGNSPVNMVPGSGLRGRIVAIDTRSATPRAVVRTRNLGMPNGLAFDRTGAMYVADSQLGLVRISAAGTIDRQWTAKAPKSFAPGAKVNGVSLNGIAIWGNHAYVTMTQSLTGRILRVDLTDPRKISVAADLTAPLPGLLDDLAVLGDGVIAATATTGQVVIANAATGRTCAVNVGRPVTSVAVSPDRMSLVAGTIDGAIVRLAPANS